MVDYSPYDGRQYGNSIGNAIGLLLGCHQGIDHAVVAGQDEGLVGKRHQLATRLTRGICSQAKKMGRPFLKNWWRA